MQYLVIPDNKTPNYLNPQGEMVRVEAFNDTAIIGTNFPVVYSLDNFTPFAIAGPFSSYEEQQQALINLNNEYQAKMASGILVEGITLAATESDQNAFTRLTTLLSSIEASLTSDIEKAGFAQSKQSIADINGTAHVLTVAQIRGIIVKYGLAVAKLWGEMAVKRMAILSATIG